MSKKNIELKRQNISYEQDGVKYHLISLKASNMTVSIDCYEKGTFSKNISLPFAHLPKKIKSLINPL